MSNDDIAKTLYTESTSFLYEYPNYDLSLLPSWLRENIDNARVYGNNKKGVILPDGRKYHLDNKLNALTGSEWTLFINSVFSTHYPTRGKEGYAHEIRKVHPSPKPPQLMRDLICFFTKENEIVMDTFSGVGGSLLGAALCNRKAIGIELNSEYISIYRKAAAALNLTEFPVILGDNIYIQQESAEVDRIIGDEKIALLLIDPPYSNMMSRKKTGADGLKLGIEGTPFTDEICDLGNMNKEDYLSALCKSVESSLKYVKQEGYVVVFIKDMQPRKKELNLLHYDVITKLNSIDKLFYKGMKIWADNSAKLYPYGYPFCFVANQIHQYILVFRKEKK